MRTSGVAARARWPADRGRGTSVCELSWRFVGCHARGPQEVCWRELAAGELALSGLQELHCGFARGLDRQPVDRDLPQGSVPAQSGEWMGASRFGVRATHAFQ